jgi:hypothetical protein
MCICRQGSPGVFKHLDGERPAYGRKVFKKDLKRVTGGQMLEQDPDWHPRADEHRRAA